VYVEIPCMKNASTTLLPNAFTPNNDGVNDEFCLQGWEPCVSEFIICIYNRWGEKVFESRDVNFCWNGTYKNVIVDAAVYTYYISAKNKESGEVIIKKGNISLLR